jgi:hypothetical protein
MSQDGDQGHKIAHITQPVFGFWFSHSWLAHRRRGAGRASHQTVFVTSSTAQRDDGPTKSIRYALFAATAPSACVKPATTAIAALARFLVFEFLS